MNEDKTEETYDGFRKLDAFEEKIKALFAVWVLSDETTMKDIKNLTQNILEAHHQSLIDYVKGENRSFQYHVLSLINNRLEVLDENNPHFISYKEAVLWDKKHENI